MENNKVVDASTDSLAKDLEYISENNLKGDDELIAYLYINGNTSEGIMALAREWDMLQRFLHMEWARDKYGLNTAEGILKYMQRRATSVVAVYSDGYCPTTLRDFNGNEIENPYIDMIDSEE